MARRARKETTEPTERLLEYCTRPTSHGPAKRLVFAQREAIKTIVDLTEIADLGLTQRNRSNIKTV